MFKKNDKVICIDDRIVGYPIKKLKTIIKGSIYTIDFISISTDQVGLININSAIFKSTRFKKLNEQLEFDF